MRKRGRSALITPTRRQRAWLIGALAAMLSVFTLDAALPPPLDRARVVSPVVEDRNGVWLRGFATPEGRWRLAADLDRIDPHFQTALIAVEDERFWLHPGVDPLALGRAALAWARSGRITQGGSTITMQLARLIEPRPRTFGSKAIEILRALQIERRLRKREILALYLSMAPYGGNLEGVRAASRAYFQKDPEWLDDAETALLLALPQAPEARRPDRHPQAARASRDRVLARMARIGVLPADRAQEASSAPIPGRTPFPIAADHLAARLAAQASGQGIIRSTVQADMQATVEAMVNRAAAGLERQATIAVLVADAPTGEIRASVGGAGRDRAGGWIDMTRAVRSPGSTLKPFIYAIAFDDGVAAPETLAADAPRRFAGYLPENFDRRFHGDVRLSEALQHSLNVPAVATLERIGAPRFAAALGLAYAAPRLPPGPQTQAGLALALGGVGMTLDELVTLYAALGADGQARPLRATLQTTQGPPRRFVRAETAERVRAILATSPSPAGRTPAYLVQNAPQVAFKTGTSYGFRDAWALGVSGRFVIGVWVGRPDGSPRAGATGRSDALPLLFDVADAIAPAGAPVSPEAPTAPAAGIARLERNQTQAPAILFPPQGAEVLVSDYGPASRGLSLSAAGGQGRLVWYAEGQPVQTEPTSGRALWRPSAPGFHTISVVDATGARASVQVRIRDR